MTFNYIYVKQSFQQAGVHGSNTHKAPMGKEGAQKTSSWTIFCAPKATGCGERTSNAKDSERCHYLCAENEHGDPIKGRISGSRSCFSMLNLSIDGDTVCGSHLPVILSF